MSTRRLLAEAESEATRILLDLAITPPLHPAEVAEYLRTELVSRSYPPDLDGYYFRTSDEQGHVVVNCNPEKPKGRILFTTCHEFYHHITADGTAAEGICYLDDSGTSDSPIERACNKFAAQLLMPRELFCEWWDDLRHNKEYREQILIGRFGVTIQALRIRERELGLA